MTVPAHVSVPAGAKQLILWHKRLDIAVFTMMTGVKRLAIGGTLVDSDRPEEDLRELGAMLDRQAKEACRIFYRIPL